MQKFKILFVSSICMLWFQLQLHAQEWELKKEEEGIKVYTQETPDGYKKFKGVVDISGSSIDAMVHLLRDDKNAPNWMFQTEDLIMLEDKTFETWVTRTLVDMPWPADDRDIVARLSLSKTNKGYKVDIKSIPDFTPLSSDHVRMQKAEGTWYYEPLDKSHIRVTYIFQSNPVGIPVWLVNLFIVDAPYQTLSAFREQLKRTEYQNIDVPAIK